jgi:hypothetical protein
MLRKTRTLVLGVSLLGLCAPAFGDTLTINFDNNSTNISATSMPTAASGNTWLTATFSDAGVDPMSHLNLVNLVLQANFAASKPGTNQGANEINFNCTTFDSMPPVSLVTSNLQHISSIAQGANSEGISPADGFDIDIQLGNGASDLQLSQVAKITFAAAGLSVNDFATTSTSGYLAAVHVQDTGPNGNNSTKLGASTDILTRTPATPAPSTRSAGLALLALLGLKNLFVRRPRTSSM